MVRVTGGPAPDSASSPALDEAAGLQVDLRELVDLRHRVAEVPLFVGRSRRSPLAGLHHSRLRGRGIDFDQVRVYQPGDDVRNIDWRVTARTQQPHTKLFHEERERPVFLLVEQSRRLYLGSVHQFKSVLAARAAALIGWAALAHNDRIGGLVFGSREYHEVKPRRSKQSLLQLLNRLTQANQGLARRERVETDTFGQALRRVREVLRPGSLAIVVCDERALDATAEQQLQLLGRHVELVLLPVSDPLDHQLPDAGLLHFQQARLRLDVDTFDPALRQAYEEQGAERQKRWTQLADRAGALLLPLTTERELVDQLREQFGLPPRRTS